MTTVRMVGGPWDGRTVDLPEGRSTCLVGPPDFDTPGCFYVLGRIGGSTRSFLIMHPDGWTGDQVLAHLLGTEEVSSDA